MSQLSSSITHTKNEEKTNDPPLRSSKNFNSNHLERTKTDPITRKRRKGSKLTDPREMRVSSSSPPGNTSKYDL